MGRGGSLGIFINYEILGILRDPHPKKFTDVACWAGLNIQRGTDHLDKLGTDKIYGMPGWTKCSARY